MKLLLTIELTWQRLKQNPLYSLLFLASFFAVFLSYYALGNTVILDSQSQTPSHEFVRQQAPYDLYMIGYTIPDQKEKIEKLNGVKAVRMIWRYPIYFTDLYTSIVGLDEAEPEIVLVEGAYPTQSDEVLLAVNLAWRYDAKVGDTVFLFSAKASEVIPIDYRVSGIMSNRLGVLCGLVGTEEGLARVAIETDALQSDPPMPGMWIKAHETANLEAVIAEIAELQKSEAQKSWTMNKYNGQNYQQDETALVSQTIAVIRNLLLLACFFFVAAFTTFAFKAFAKENGILLALGLDRPWLVLMNLFSFIFIGFIAMLCLWFALPLTQTVFGLTFWSFKMTFPSFCRDMMPIALVSLAVAILYNLSYLKHEAAVWLRDDWLD